jgi:glycosyltransferase involved in cell wall biosynthesis
MSTVQERSASRSIGSGDSPLRVSVVIPCLNEADAIEQSVASAVSALTDAALAGEVLVVDNGSEDGSAELAERAGARVIREPRRGYGSAYLAGFDEARGEYIVMLDADLTYPAGDIPRFVEQLEDGAELVMGDRMDNIQPGAMPWLHRYVGNPILSGILNMFFRTGVRDAHCGMRAFRRDVLPKLDLRTTGMEFASEMVIRAAKERLDIRQIPIEYRPRAGESKLSSFRDGWRHLRFLLVHQPTYLFLIPGAFMSFVGALITFTVAAQVNVLGRAWDIHTMIAGALLLIVGSQVLSLGLAARAYGVYFMGERDRLFEYLDERVRLEHGLLAGAGLILLGVLFGGVIVYRWAERGFGALSEARLAVLAASVMIVGIQIFFSSFLLSILGLRRQS